MEETFEMIEKQSKGDQLNILLELLQENGAALQIMRNQSRHSIDSDTVKMVKNKWMECERIKNKIKQLYELPVQNIAQP